MMYVCIYILFYVGADVLNVQIKGVFNQLSQPSNFFAPRC